MVVRIELRVWSQHSYSLEGGSPKEWLPIISDSKILNGSTDSELVDELGWIKCCTNPKVNDDEMMNEIDWRS